MWDFFPLSAVLELAVLGKGLEDAYLIYSACG